MDVEGSIVEGQAETVRYERPPAWVRACKVLATYVAAGLVWWGYLETQYAMQHVSLNAAAAWFGIVGFLVTTFVLMGFVGIRHGRSESQCKFFILAIPAGALLMTSSILTMKLTSCIDAESIRAFSIIQQPKDVGAVFRNDLHARITLNSSRLLPYSGESNAFTSMFYRVTVLEYDVLFGEHVPSLQTPLPIQPDGLLWLSLAPANWSVGFSFAMIDLQRHYPLLNLSAAPFILSTNDLLSELYHEERSCRWTWCAMTIALPIITAGVMLTDVYLSYIK